MKTIITGKATSEPMREFQQIAEDCGAYEVLWDPMYEGQVLVIFDRREDVDAFMSLAGEHMFYPLMDKPVLYPTENVWRRAASYSIA